MPSSDHRASRCRAARAAARGRASPGRVHLGAERREDAEPPSSSATTMSVRWGGRPWPAPARAGTRRRAPRCVHRSHGACALVRRARRARAGGRQRPSSSSARPSRTGPARARPGSGGDDHAVALDLLDRQADAPSRKTWPSHASCTRLLVGLPFARAVDREHPRRGPQVGDRAGASDGDALRSLASARRARRALPDDARRIRRTVQTDSGPRAGRGRSPLLARELAGLRARRVFERARTARRRAAPRPMP